MTFNHISASLTQLTKLRIGFLHFRDEIKFSMYFFPPSVIHRVQTDDRMNWFNGYFLSLFLDFVCFFQIKLTGLNPNIRFLFLSCFHFEFNITFVNFVLV